MDCPNCAQAMENGWLAMYNPTPLVNYVAWQETKPGYVRMTRPEGSEKVIVPKAGGHGCPQAQLCRNCKTVVFSYAEDQLD